MDYLKAKGICVVFVSHRLDEVLEISDRVTVIRDGNKIGTWPAAEITGDRLTELMTGLKLDYRPKSPSMNKDRVLLEADRPSRAGQYQDVSFRLHQGEVLGLCGAARLRAHRAGAEPCSA